MVKKYIDIGYQELVLRDMNNIVGALQSKNHNNIRTLHIVNTSSCQFSMRFSEVA